MVETPYMATSASTYAVAEGTQATCATLGFAVGLYFGGIGGSFIGLMVGDYVGKKLGMSITEDQRKKEKEAYVPKQDTYQYEASYLLTTALTIFSLNFLAPATVTAAGQVAYTGVTQGGYRALHLAGMEGGKYLKKSKPKKKEKKGEEEEDEKEREEFESKDYDDFVRTQISSSLDKADVVFLC
jgi:hypothetical protein